MKDVSESGATGRPIIRALDILCALNRRAYATLQDLNDDTQLPKPTIHRILATLIDQGYVARDPLRGIYRLTARVQLLSAGFGEPSRVVDVGADIVRSLTAEIKWPLALGTRQGMKVVVRYSTMPFSPYAVRATTVNRQHSLLGSAMGTAYLAACPDRERSDLLAMMRSGDDLVARLARDEAYVASVIQKTRSLGYALRRAGPHDDSSTIAVAIEVGDHVAGVVSLTMFRRSLTESAIRESLPVLQHAAASISTRLQESVPSPPPRRR